jgi:hypothetical protein
MIPSSFIYPAGLFRLVWLLEPCSFILYVCFVQGRVSEHLSIKAKIPLSEKDRETKNNKIFRSLIFQNTIVFCRIWHLPGIHLMVAAGSSGQSLRRSG